MYHYRLACFLTIDFPVFFCCMMKFMTTIITIGGNYCEKLFLKSSVASIPRIKNPSAARPFRSTALSWYRLMSRSRKGDFQVRKWSLWKDSYLNKEKYQNFMASYCIVKKNCLLCRLEKFQIKVGFNIWTLYAFSGWINKMNKFVSSRSWHDTF